MAIENDPLYLSIPELDEDFDDDIEDEDDEFEDDEY